MLDYKLSALFQGVAYSFILLDKADVKKQADRDARILSLPTLAPGATGARRADFVNSVAKARAGKGYHYVLVHGDAPLADIPLGALKGHRGVQPMGWLKACLIAGRVLPVARITAED